MKFLLKLTLLLIVNLIVLNAQNLNLDSTFHKIGYNFYEISSDDASSNCVELDIAGSLFLGGKYYINFDDQMLLLKLKKDGKIDSSFANYGIYSNSKLSNILDMEFDRNGNLVIIGSSKTPRGDFGVIRLLPNGTLDKNFSSDGITQIDYKGKEDFPSVIKFQSDGKILIGGRSGDGFYSDHLLVRLNSDGSLDNTFNSLGTFYLSLGSQIVDGISDMFVDSNNDIYTLLKHYKGANLSGDYDLTIIKLNAQGVLDPQFGIAGVAQFDLNKSTDIGYKIMEDNNNNLLIGGSTSIAGTDQIFIAKMKKNGNLDSSFAKNGISIIRTKSFTNCYAMQILSNQKIMLGGRIGTTGRPDGMLLRLKSNGDLDSSFATKGFLTLDGKNSSDEIRDLKIDNEGRIIFTGYGEVDTYDKVLVGRLNKEVNVGVIDNENSLQTIIAYPNPVEKDFTLQFELLKSQTLSARLINQDGQIIEYFFHKKEFNSGNHVVGIKINNTPTKGIYFLELFSAQNNRIIKIILN